MKTKRFELILRENGPLQDSELYDLLRDALNRVAFRAAQAGHDLEWELKQATPVIKGPKKKT